MKYNYLRLMLLSMLVMLCGVTFAEDKNVTIDLVGNAYNEDIVTSEGTSSTGGNMVLNTGDVVVSSALGYVKKGEMSIYKNGSLTIALSENVTGHLTKVVLTLTNSYNFNEPGGDWTSVYSTEGTSAKVAKGSTETFTTTATNITSLTLQNAANGKTGISKIEVEYVAEATAELLTPTMSFSPSEVTVTEGETFTLPTLTYDGDGAITYSSSAPNVASVNETTGEVEVLSAGTASIIATAAKTDTYKSATASYTITVNLSTAGLTLPWTEDWSKYAVNEVPSKKNYNYSEDNGGGTTKIYEQNSAGGTSPELLIAKSNGSFTASNISLASLEGKAAKLVLSYHTNQASMSVTTTVDGVEIGDAVKDDTDTKLYTREITVPAGATTLDITFMMTTTSNGRIDDISLVLGELVEEEIGFRDIKADLTQLQDLATGSNVYITVAEDGTISQTDNADKAAATLKGSWHNASYGWKNFTASVPVEGTVKITYATHDYGNEIKVTNAEGEEVAKLNTKGAKWSSSHDNVVSTYYRVNEPTTLNFSNADYNPYFAVEAIAPEDIPAEVTTYNVTFSAGDAQGEAPAAIEVEDGSAVKLPKNYTLYKEGYTLTGWNDGTETHEPGTEITPTADVALTPVFTKNSVSIAEREGAVVVAYVLNGYEGYPQHNIQGKTGIIVTQATVDGSTIDVAANVDATSGKFVANGTGWHIVNAGTKVTVPACKDAKVSVTAYTDPTSALKFNGATSFEVNEKTATYTVADDTETVEIEQTVSGYWNNLTITLPAPSADEPSPFPVTEDVTAMWDYSDADVMNATMALSGGSGTVDDVAKDGIKMTVEANGATFRNNGNNIQVRQGAVFKVPVQSTNDVVTVKGYPNYSYYTIANGAENNNTNDNPETTYKAKLADVEQGYVEIKSTNNNNYYYYIKVDLKAPKEPVTLDGEEATATFPLHEGTEGQKAEFGDDADYFLSSKVDHGDGLTIEGKNSPQGLESPVETLFQPTAKVSTANDDNAIKFIIIPKPGFSFTPTSVSITATRFGTDDGLLDFAWLNPDNTTVTLATGMHPNRNSGTKKHDTDTDEKFTVYTYDIEGATVAEGQCGLQVNLYGLANNKQVGLSDIVINGTLSGTEKDMPILASFKLNGKEYAADDVFEIDGADYVGNIKISKSETMIGEDNPLTDITPASGEIGTVTYEGSETACTVTIPMTAGEESINYILNVTQKPDYTLTYIGLDGEAIDTQTVEEDAEIGTFAVDIATVTGAQDGYKARGWFKNDYVGEKYQTSDVITSDVNLYAIETEIEGPSDSRKYEFNLADPFFYAEDHEAFTPTEGSKCGFHDNTHGWAFYNGDQVDLLVGSKATIYVTLCKYGHGTSVLVLDANGETLETLAGISETDGELQTYNYEGSEGKISLKFESTGEMYIHNVKIVNTTTTNYEKNGQWITAKAGDASSFLDALDAANGMSGDDRVYIFLPDGTYDLGQTFLTHVGRNNISIIGQSTEGTIIKNKAIQEGIGVTAVLLNTSKNLYMQDLTLQNEFDYYNAPSNGRAVCLQDKGDNTVCKNVRMLSYQDTYYTNNADGNYYWEDSEIHGTVDFICGEGTLFMENSKLFVEKRKADGTGECTITAPSTKDGNRYGYVFNNCTIENEAAHFNLGRAWNNKPRAAFLNTTILNDKLIDSRWTVTGMNNNNPVEFVEYKSVDENGNVISPASNSVTFSNAGGVTLETILTDAQAAEFTLDKVFTGWTPAEFTVQVDAPEAEIADGVITWQPIDDAIAYAVFKNGELQGITSDSSFDTNADSETHAAPRKEGAEDAFTIRAANAHGGFGIEKPITIATGIENVSAEKGNVVSTTYYNISGARVSDSAKGVLLKVEKLENGQTVTTKVVR